jgi:hypothetical protein
MRIDTIITDEQNLSSSKASGSEILNANNSGIITIIIITVYKKYIYIFIIARCIKFKYIFIYFFQYYVQ